MFPCPDEMINLSADMYRLQASEPELDTTKIENCCKIFREVDNLYEVHDQDRKNIWQLRNYWMSSAPEILPKLLFCIDWDKRDEVSDVVALLRKWPLLAVEKSLELLDYAYADQEVRKFAVRCLKDLRFVVKKR